MDRKEFLHLVGASIIGIIGVSKILKSLEEMNKNSSPGMKSAPKKGYGSTAYGE